MLCGIYASFPVCQENPTYPLTLDMTYFHVVTRTVSHAHRSDFFYEDMSPLTLDHSTSAIIRLISAITHLKSHHSLGTHIFATSTQAVLR